jgi:tetratricopeptide (TPR) repeat protein
MSYQKIYNTSKPPKTKFYSEEELKNIRELIKKYFAEIHPDTNLNSNESNYLQLVEAVNTAYGENILTTRFVCDIYNQNCDTKRKSIKKISSLADYIHDFFVSKEKQEVEIKLDEEVKPFLDQLKELIDENKFDEAEELYEKAKEITDKKNDEYSRAKLQKQYARVLKDKYFNREKEDELLLSCLKVFEKYNKEEDIASTKEMLAQVRASLGDLNSAEIFITDFLEYAKQKESDDKLATGYIVAGYVHLEKGNYKKANDCMDEAIKFGTRLLLNNDEKKVATGNEVITFSHHNKSFIYMKDGNILEAKASCLKALEGHRKLQKKKELAQLLFEMTEIECFEGNFATGKWKEYIEEAKSIFLEIKDFSSLARCIDLVSRIAYSTGQKELSLQIFEEGYEEIKKTKDKRGIAHFLGQFVSYYKSQKNTKKAKEYIAELIEFAKENGLNVELVHAYQDLADIADIEGDIVTRDEYLLFVITELEKRLKDEQSNSRKANILGQIADVYTRQGKIRESLSTFEKVASIYQTENVIGGFAKSTLIIAELNLQLGNREIAIQHWLKVSDITKGTAFHEFASIAKLNIGSYLLTTGEYESAQRHLEEAKHLIEKYKLKHSEQVEHLLWEINERKQINSPIEKEFPELIEKLYNGINKKIESFEPILRHWYHKNEMHIYKHFYQATGIKAILYSDDLAEINLTTSSLNWLFDYFLIASSEYFEPYSSDLFLSPYEEYEAGEHFVFVSNAEKEELNTIAPLSFEDKILHTLNQPNEKGKFPSYVFCPTEINGEIKVFVVGRGKGLPQIAYNFIEQKTSEYIINSRTFVSNIPRHTLRDKLYSDILFCWQLNFIPVYLNEEPQSEDVTIIGSITTKIPFGNFADKQVSNKAKKYFNSLLKIEKSKAKTDLNEIYLDLDSLFSGFNQLIKAKISLAEISYSGKKILYPIIFLYK